MDALSTIRVGDQVVVFSVGGYTYAAPIETVRGIHPAVAVTWVPDPPPNCEGMINLRGTLVPVFNLRERLGLGKQAGGLPDHFLFVQKEGWVAAYRVDLVTEVATVSEIVASTGEDAAAEDDPVAGAVKVGDRLVPVIDLTRLIDHAGIRHLETQRNRLSKE